MKIYKSNFSAEELAQWEALVAKGKVAPEEAQEEMEGQEPAFPRRMDRASALQRADGWCESVCRTYDPLTSELEAPKVHHPVGVSRVCYVSA